MHHPARVTDLRVHGAAGVQPGAEESAMATGMPSGQIYLWRDGQAVRAVTAHAHGPEVITPDGTVVSPAVASPSRSFSALGGGRGINDKGLE